MGLTHVSFLKLFYGPNALGFDATIRLFFSFYLFNKNCVHFALFEQMCRFCLMVMPRAVYWEFGCRSVTKNEFLRLSADRHLCLNTRVRSAPWSGTSMWEIFADFGRLDYLVSWIVEFWFLIFWGVECFDSRDFQCLVDGFWFGHACEKWSGLFLNELWIVEHSSMILKF